MKKKLVINKKLIITITSVVCAVAILSVSLFFILKKEEQHLSEKYRFTDGIHDLTAPEANGFIVENGKSDYKILIPNEPDSNEVIAESELRYFFEEATGVKLTTVTESEEGFSHSAEGKYISIGETKMLESAKLDLKREVIGSQGVRIVTKDNNIYLIGKSSIGTLNSVYSLLNILFDYEQFAYDCFTLNKSNNVKLRDFNVIDVPDIEYRASASRLTENNPNNLEYRLRTVTWNEFFLPIGDLENTEYGAFEHVVHNTSNVIPRGAPTSRENWFSNQSGEGPDNTQLCYTARGNKEDYEALVERIAYVLERSLIRYTPDKYPLRNIIAFTHEDNSSVMCRCDSCIKAEEKYGAPSGVAIVLSNDVMKKLQEWMNKPENAQYKREDLRLVFFAYASFVEAPAHYDEEQGKYVINHPDLQMRDDVGVFYAISGGLSYQQNIYCEDSKEGVENSLKWFDISPSVYLWTYDANFGNFLFRTAGTNFYDTDAYQFFARGKAKMMFKQSTMPGANVTSFQMLDIYLDSKMQWDTTQDINELTQRWFDAMFREASDVMFDLYVQQNNRAIIIAYETAKIAQTGIINYSIGREYWQYEMLNDWLNKIDQARELVEKYKVSDPSLYKVLKEHIDTEWVCPAYHMLAYNSNNLSDARYNEMAMYFKTEISQLRDFQFSEKSPNMISSWSASLSLR
ncbi:MAG: DUF4838 domain-containing protein [Clostridia bacterium]|nr:DUF4838 domain-containing protein [Clostridia bacterium]MBQ4099038.1 DUF4838 domain-containing protein [Clostridia bacterium]